MQTLQRYSIVNTRGRLLDNDSDYAGLTLSNAERILSNVLNHGANAFIQDEELSPLAAKIVANFKAKPELYDVLRTFKKKGWTREEVKSTVGIGFCCPKFYKPEAWRRAKNLMDKLLVPLDLAYPHDYGRGKAKYSTNEDWTKVQAEVMDLISGREGDH